MVTSKTFEYNPINLKTLATKDISLNLKSGNILYIFNLAQDRRE